MTQEACLRCGAPRPDANPICTNCGTPFGAAPGQPGGSGPAGEEPTMVAGASQPGAPQPEGQPDWAQQPHVDPPTQQFPADSGQWGPPAGQPGGVPAAGQPGGQWGPPAEGQWGPPAEGQWGPPAGGQWGPPPGGPGGPQQPWDQGPQGGGSGGKGGKIALIVGIVVLLVIGGVIAAVVLLGGDDDDDDKKSSRNASVEEFCEVWDELEQYDSDDEEGFAAGQEHLKKIEEVGTPEDIPEDARAGFELYLDVVGRADSPDDIDTLGEELLEDEDKKRQMDAFFTYQGETCSSAVPTPSVTAPTDLPTVPPTDLPTDVPTDFPTDFPSDFPTDFPTSFNPSDLGLDEDTLKELEELESMLAELSEYASPR